MGVVKSSSARQESNNYNYTSNRMAYASEKVEKI